jgi:hypothetical protein
MFSMSTVRGSDRVSQVTKTKKVQLGERRSAKGPRSRSRKDVTDAKVSERYDEHQSSSLLGDTKSSQSGGLVEGK